MKLDWAAKSIPELEGLDEAAIGRMLKDAYRRIPWILRLLLKPLNAFLAVCAATAAAWLAPLVSAVVAKLGVLARIAGFLVGGGAGLSIGTYIKRRILLRLLRPYVRKCIEEASGGARGD
ncbi:MAG: hypothetical protein ACYSU0_07780 [Planctomycetota bacterium]|jgi:hypothetical protein